MKRLILVRHAKSSWSDSEMADKDRPLNRRGITAASIVGGWLSAKGLGPDQVISSTAKRCFETWVQISKEVPQVADVRFDDGLYLAEAGEMLGVLKTARGQTVLMVGHMPGLGEFAHSLRQDPPPRHDIFRKYPTAAATVLDFNIRDWSEVQMGTGVFHAYATPADM